MIKTITDFARSVYDNKLKEIEQYLRIVTHPVARGDMYEGLTSDIVKKTFGNVPDIHIGEGFIKNYRTGKISPQTDVIIYYGESENIPETKHKIVSIDHIIAFIEVKKVLGLAELADFYDKQGNIYDLVDNQGIYDKELFNDIATKVFGRNCLNDESIKDRPKLEYYLYHILKVENSEPLRICFGYEGGAKEKTLRDDLLKVINERGEMGKPHTGMNSLPSLVISGDNCLIKMVGCPYAYAFRDPYPIMVSSRCDTLKILLQMLLSKIESKAKCLFDLGSDDFATQNFHRYLDASINAKDNDSTQYFLHDMSTSEMKKEKCVEEEWKPTIITHFEFGVAMRLCHISLDRNPSIPINDPMFEGHDLEKELKNLIRNRFVSIHDNVVELVSISCQLMVVEDHFLIGENNAGQFTNWAIKRGKKDI